MHNFHILKRGQRQALIWTTRMKRAIKERAGEWEVHQQLREAIQKRTCYVTVGVSVQDEKKWWAARWWAATEQEKGRTYAKKQFWDDSWGRTCFDWLQET
jgi:hypothetical protein